METAIINRTGLTSMCRTVSSLVTFLILAVAGISPWLRAERSLAARHKTRLAANIATDQDTSSSDRKIVIGDTLVFRIVEDEDPPVTLRVDEAGRIKVPYLGTMPAAGKSTPELALEIKHALERSLYKKATVMIAIARRPDAAATSGPANAAVRSSGRIYLSGEVNKQGPLDLPGDEALTVSRAILRAGGFSEFANRKKVKLIRRTGDTLNTRIVDVALIMDGGRPDLDPVLQTGDIIEVPQRLVNW